MKLLSRVRSAQHQLHKNNNATPSSLKNAAPHPCQLKCKVNGPDGNQVALVPICLPLSIMAGFAVKAAGGSDELARIASVSVISQGNTVVAHMRNETLLTERDINGYIDTVAQKTRETILSIVGDARIADEVESMIRGGGQLILNLNKDENGHEESRDDDVNENDIIIGEDVQSIATSVLNNFDRDMMMSISNDIASQYAVNDHVATKPTRNREYTWGPSGNCSTTVTEIPVNNAVYCVPSRSGFWAWNSSPERYKDEELAQFRKTNGRSNRAQQHYQEHPPKQTSFDTTWGISNNTQDYEATSNFDLDLFGCPNLSTEPVHENEEVIWGMSTKNYNGAVTKTESSDYTMNSTGRGIFAISSNVDCKGKSGIPMAEVVTSPSAGIHYDHNNANKSLTTRSLRPEMVRSGYYSCNTACTACQNATSQTRNDGESINGQCAHQSYVEPSKECDDILDMSTRNYNGAVKKTDSSEYNSTGRCIFATTSNLDCKGNITSPSAGINLGHYNANHSDTLDESINCQCAHQSYIEPSKECDDITYLNTQQHQSLFKRVRQIFRKMNCKNIN